MKRNPRREMHRAKPAGKDRARVFRGVASDTLPLPGTRPALQPGAPPAPVANRATNAEPRPRGPDVTTDPPHPESNPVAAPLPPPRVPDHELLRRIGRGAYGEVWLARSVLGAFRAVKIVHRNAFDHDRLSTPGKAPLSETLSSDSTASWSAARGRLPVAVVYQALHWSGETIRATVQNRHWHGMEPVLWDGTTFRLRPWGNIPEHFPPHGGGNNRAPYWCLARSVVAFCLATGVVLDAAVGSTQQSEQALTLGLWQGRRWENTIFVADRNFGVYAVVRGAREVQAHIVARLTAARAKKLAREAGVRLEAGCDQVIEGKPTRHDQCPEIWNQAPVVGRLIALRVDPRGARSFMRYLFTTLVDPQISAEAWAQLYGQRWQVELDRR
jgi:hypothetical protein